MKSENKNRYPTIGRIVLVRGDSVLPGESYREVPGIITRVWGDDCVDITVFKSGHAGIVGLVSVMSHDASYGEHAGSTSKPNKIETTWRWPAREPENVKSEGKRLDSSIPQEGQPLRHNPGFVGGFGWALVKMKDGDRLARVSWNGSHMWVYHVPANSYPAQTEAAKLHIGELVEYVAYLALKTTVGNVVPWLASQSDILAEDWFVLL